MKIILTLLFLSLLPFQSVMEDKSIDIPEISYEGEINCLKASKLLEEKAEAHSVDIINWPEIAHKPEVKFRMAHSDNQIWLKFYVKEKNILAKQSATNSMVCTDSCVEFFFDPMGDGNYYNFEFSCIGVSHVAYGPGRKNRKFIKPEIIESQIKAESTLGKQNFAEKTGGYSWELTVIIPVECLVYNKGLKLNGLESKANLYKCGDNTSNPHYLTWNRVGTEKPDFHQPEYFGNLNFK